MTHSESVSSPATSIQIDINGLSIAALHSKMGDARHRLLCVHGWLDNANSFLPLMPLLKNTEIVAIDLPGHGYSGHLPRQADYHIADMPFILLDCARALGWESFHLVGHSLGGCIATLTAAAAPEVLISMVLLEASGPVSETAADLPQRLKRARQQRLDSSRFESRLFASADDAVSSRQAAAKISSSAARLIIDRQLRQDKDGLRWRFDIRHRLASPIYMTESQVLSVLSAIECQTLVVLADEGYIVGREQSADRLNSLTNAEINYVPGHHHMHMDDPQPTAKAINLHFDQWNF